MTTLLKWTHLFITLLLLTVTASCTVGSDPDPVPAKRPWREQDLEQVVENWRIQSGVPGVVVGISIPDRSEIVITSGQSNTQDNIAMKEDDQFRIASISKTFIAAEVLILAEDGKIQLDDPMNVY